LVPDDVFSHPSRATIVVECASTAAVATVAALGEGEEDETTARA
jgi:hypothetical protein